MMNEIKKIIRIWVLNGPNLNLLGSREPGIYGSETLEDMHRRMRSLQSILEAELHQTYGFPIHIQLSFFQSNAEHLLLEKIHEVGVAREAGLVGISEGVQACGQADFMIFNPAAFTHTSIALRDALLAVRIPFVEVHLSDPMQRESFRKVSFFSDIAHQVISGRGIFGYELALRAAIEYVCAVPFLDMNLTQ